MFLHFKNYYSKAVIINISPLFYFNYLFYFIFYIDCNVRLGKLFRNIRNYHFSEGYDRYGLVEILGLSMAADHQHDYCHEGELTINK